MPNKMGRPTKYRPEYCQQVIEMGKEGKSIAQMCSQFDISRQTIDNWAAENPDFLDALTRARVHMQAKLEEMGLAGLGSRDFNAQLWKTTMQARFREDYTERQKTEITGKDGKDLIPGELDHRKTARAILNVLRKADRKGE